MSSTPVPPAPVTVGVDGTAASHVAAQAAVRLAQRRGTSVRLAHAWAHPVLHGGAQALVQQVLEGIDVPAGVPLEVQVEQVPALALLERLGDGSSLLVVGRHEDGVSRLMTGDLAVALSGRARCPVLSVPEQWRRRSTGPHRVVVAVDHAHESSAALSYAFAEAVSRHAHLVVTHAVARTTDGREHGDARRRVTDVVAPWQAAFPDVDVEVDAGPGHPAVMLQSASRWADLVVVERPTRSMRRPRLGPVLRHVVSTSRCPVVVVPEPAAVLVPPAPLTAGAALR